MADSLTEPFDPGLIVAKILVELFKPENAGKASKVLQNATEESIKTIVSALLNMGGPIALAIGRGIIEGESDAQQVMDQIAALGIEDLLGVQVPASGLTGRGSGGARKQLGNAIGAAVLKAVSGSNAALEPSTAQAERFIGTMASFAVEGWLEGWIVEFLTSIVPAVGNIETFAELDDIMAEVMGFGRLSRRVLSPLIDASTVTPMKWHVSKTYRPELLSPAACARQIARHPEQKEVWLEDLRRQGYSERRIEALLNEQQKGFSPSDVRQFVYRGHWTESRGHQHLMDQGWDDDGANDAIRLEGLRRIEQLEGQEASAIIGAFAAGDIDEGTMRSLLLEAVGPEAERNLLLELARVRREVNVKRLSLSQVEAMVRSGVLSVVDYRRAAERDGYSFDDVTALELQLRWELDKAKAIEEHRRELEIARAKDKADRALELAKRKAEIEAERKLARRGAESDLERAAIRGLIPIARVAEVYGARYDAETVGILSELLEADRTEYVAQQQARAEALKRAGRRSIDVGALESAVRSGVLTDQDFRARLAALGFDAGDVGVLAGTLAAQMRDQKAAEDARQQAIKAARVKRIDLGRFEVLVRRGHRPIDQYAELLRGLGFDDASVAGMVELLELRMADDATARAEREAAEARLNARGLSLEQFRRAVILGIKTVADYERFLIDQRFTADAQVVLLAEVRADVAEAEAARRRRAAAESAPDTREISLATVRSAVRLGVISVDAYRDRLTRAGYSAEDVELDIDLLVAEIAADAATRQARDALDRIPEGETLIPQLERIPPGETLLPERPMRALTLAELGRAVKAGLRPITDYRAAVASVYPDPRDVDTIVALLERELELARQAEERRRQIEAEQAARGLSLGQLESVVKGGLQSLDDYYAELVGMGYSLADAELLTALLGDQLAAKGSGAS